MPATPVKLENRKILVTGPSGQVALPVARELAKANDVYGLARFGNADARARVESIGVRPVRADLAADTDGSLEWLDDDFDYVLHFAVAKTGDFDRDLAANVEGLGRLMHHCRRAEAFFYCSSAAVYEESGHRPLTETDPLGDNHRVMFPTYSICKIAAEAMVRFGARQWGLSSTIARLSVPYGGTGGWPWFHVLMMQAGSAIPVHADAPSTYNPIYEDDYVAQIPALLAIADVPATVVNWGGSETVSIEQWCRYLGELTGLEPRFQPTRETLGPLPLDLTRMHELVGETTVAWQDGMRRMVEALGSELLR